MKLARRKFLGSSAAAVVAAGTLVRGDVFGANDRIRLCVVGLNGRGNSHIREFSKRRGCEVVALCDVDSDVLDLHARAVGKGDRKKPKLYRDIRDVLADDSIDAISIATPNHWHSLMAIWGCQARKDVFVEKPLSHSVWEGRQLVAAAERTGQVVVHGTQSRSNPTWIRDIRLLQEGLIGPMHMAKGFTYKTGNRHAIGYGKPTKPPKNLDWKLWQGPAQERDYLAKSNGSGLYVHYNWHWNWDYGNGESANQGVHQMDLAVWGLNRGLPVKVSSVGGRYVWDDDGETPNTQISTYTYADGSILEFEVRNLGSYEEAGKVTGNHFFCADGYYVEGRGFFDYKNKPIKVNEPKPESDGVWENFLEAVRSRKASDIHGSALDGHLSCVTCHIGNIAYRLGRALEFNPKKERFVNDDDANAMLRRNYREGFEVPDLA